MLVNALGIDVEEWFHICGVEKILNGHDLFSLKSRVLNNTAALLEVLKEHNVKATFFVLGSLAQDFPELVRKIADNHHEIACHSFNHIPVYQQSKDEFEKDLKKAIEVLTGITGKKILGFRAPDFSIVKKSLWALDILKDAGIKYDSSIFPVLHPRYGIPFSKTFAYEIKSGLIEFPPSTIRILGNNFPIAGGAYLRILPYEFIKRSIQKLNAQNIPANIYLHPWEIDCEQPRLKIPLIRRFMHYAGLKTALPKLRRLLLDFKFATVSEVLGIG